MVCYPVKQGDEGDVGDEVCLSGSEPFHLFHPAPPSEIGMALSRFDVPSAQDLNQFLALFCTQADLDLASLR